MKIVNIELKYNSNLKTYNAKAAWGVYEVLLLSSTACTLWSLVSKQRFQKIKLFPFLSNNCQKMGNMRIGIEIINPCIFPILPVYFIFFENLLREKPIAAEEEISYLLLIYYISDLIIDHWFCDGKENGMNWHNIV